MQIGTQTAASLVGCAFNTTTKRAPSHSPSLSSAGRRARMLTRAQASTAKYADRNPNGRALCRLRVQHNHEARPVAQSFFVERWSPRADADARAGQHRKVCRFAENDWTRR